MHTTRPRSRRGAHGAHSVAACVAILFLLLAAPLAAALDPSTEGAPDPAGSDPGGATWAVELVEQVLDALDTLLSTVDGPALGDEDGGPDEAGPEIEPGG